MAIRQSTIVPVARTTDSSSPSGTGSGQPRGPAPPFLLWLRRGPPPAPRGLRGLPWPLSPREAAISVASARHPFGNANGTDCDSATERRRRPAALEAGRRHGMIPRRPCRRVRYPRYFNGISVPHTRARLYAASSVRFNNRGGDIDVNGCPPLLSWVDGARKAWRSVIGQPAVAGVAVGCAFAEPGGSAGRAARPPRRQKPDGNIRPRATPSAPAPPRPPPPPPCYAAVNGRAADRQPDREILCPALSQCFVHRRAHRSCQWQSNPRGSDRAAQADSATHIFHSKTDGLLRFFVEGDCLDAS